MGGKRYVDPRKMSEKQRKKWFEPKDDGKIDSYELDDDDEEESRASFSKDGTAHLKHGHWSKFTLSVEQQMVLYHILDQRFD